MMELAKKCPFLKRVPSSFLRKAGPSLLAYVEKCPVMSQLLSSTPAEETPQNIERETKTCAESTSDTSPVKECPFLAAHGQTVTTPVMATSTSVDYSEKPQEMPAKNEHCPFESGKYVVNSMENVQNHTFENESVAKEKDDVGRISSAVDNEGPPGLGYLSSHFNYDSFFNSMIKKKKEDHSYRIFKKVNRNAINFPLADDYSFSNEPKRVTVWCSNDYLGMSRNPEVIAAAKYVINNHGVGAGGTRNISGTSLYHELLEKLLAEWHQKEAGLLFTSCYVANDTTLYTLGTQLPGCIIFSDKGNHASMIQGIRTSGAKKVLFNHNDPEDLELVLKQADPKAPKIVAFETVHSMTGAVCPVEKLCDIAHKYGAYTFVDEVHAVGLYGDHGAGIGERDGVLDKMDIITGTLGKAVGVIGGYVVGSTSFVDSMRSYGSGFIFTTAPPPDKVYASMTSIEILKSDKGRELRQRHQSTVKTLRNMLVRKGFPVEYAPSHILPIVVGNADQCTKVSNALQEKHNIYVQAINYPTVPRGREKLRIAPTPWHTEEMMRELVNALDAIWREAGLPFLYPVCEVGCSCQRECKENTFDSTIPTSEPISA